MEKCPECSEKIVTKNFEKFCSGCGFVVDDSFLESDSSCNQLMPTESVGGAFTYKIRGFRDIFLLGKKSFVLFEVRKDMDRVCHLLNLPEYVKQEANRLVKMAIDKKLSLGRDFDCIAGACVFLSAKKFDIQINMMELADCCMINIGSLEAYIAKINNELQTGIFFTRSKLRRQLIDLFCRKIIGKEILSECFKTADLLKNKDFSERVTAACIAFYSIQKRNFISQENFLNKVNISQNNFSKVYEKINTELLLAEWQKTNTYK